MSRTNWSGRACRGAAPAFSLVEMLVVIGIIGILVALAIVTGTKVISGGKARATQDVIRVLDQSRDTWMLNWDKPMPEFLEVELKSNRLKHFAMIDARDARIEPLLTSAPEPSLTYYTALVMRDPMIRPIFEQLDSTFVKPSTLLSDANARAEHARALDITDAWGRPIRFVHPAFHGGYGKFWDEEAGRMETQRKSLTVVPPPSNDGSEPMLYRRSYRPFDPNDQGRKSTWAGDADEGMCVGNQPYFYSPGEDGDPGARADNVYSTVPRFPVETRDFD